MDRLFLLSPARCGGVRARHLLSPTAGFELARRVQSESGAPIGEVFAFVSGLYFRGKLAYARRFACVDAEPELGGGVLVITPTAGLRAADTPVTRQAIEQFAGTDIDLDNVSYRRPLEASTRRVAAVLGSECEVVLLGSIASPKYVDVLLDVFGDRLVFPIAFVGRGDMSRGGLLLRHAAGGEELEYAKVAGAVRRGVRPPKLPKLVR